MMNNNKILTVSYGTFSCTLEGFDDSFGTMKAIAEYFRDLAAEDRYFGAEPPQPDAEMLAHIAQREISRRVQAREQDGKIVLSAHSDDPVEPARQTLSAPADASYVSSSFAPRRPNEISAYYDAYRLNALKTQDPAPAAPVADVAAQSKAEAAVPENSGDAESVSDAADAVADIPAAEPEQDEPAAKAEADDAQAFFADSIEEPAPAEDDANAPAPAELAEIEAPAAPAPKPDSIAAKLQRIRAVVSRQEAAATEPDYSEDEHADEKLTLGDTADTDAPAQTETVVTDAIHDIEEAFDLDDSNDAPQAEAAQDDDEDDDVSALLSRLDAEDRAKDGAAQEADAAPAATDAVTPPEPQPAPAPRGRVIKVKRADLDLAIAKGDLEEYSIEDDAADTEEDTAASVDDTSDANEAAVADAAPVAADAPSTDRSSSSLSAEEEEELARELAEVEAALHEEPAEAHSKTDTSQRRSLPVLDDAKGSDMNRLLAETDNQMDDPESAVRRNAITHLRAAVAAKKADVALGAAEREEDDDAYRNDLAEVVRPRRPVSTTARTERPAETRPAPLKLVAAQRIDTEQPQAAMPVRPRRVSAVASGTASGAAPVPGGFAEFANTVGAVTLTELLEAAAAYMAFVEGLDQFSRPQLMSTVRQIDQEDFSREDGLRSFGQLLRTGKIHKLDGGRFRASDDIGFQPDTRAAG
jgi:pilus assembly protein FimV